jgi:hypothetical protein
MSNDGAVAAVTRTSNRRFDTGMNPVWWKARYRHASVLKKRVHAEGSIVGIDHRSSNLWTGPDGETQL